MLRRIEIGYQSISNDAQYVTPDSRFIAKRSKCACLAHEIGFSAPNSCSLSRLVKSATQLCASQKESVINCTCLRLGISDWLITMIGGGGLLLVVPHVYAVPVSVLLVGLPKKKKTAKLTHLILLSRVTY
jgi:hypothetical protein